MTHPIIFICYSSRDEEEKDQLLVRLNDLKNDSLICNIWSDSQLAPGSRYKNDIKDIITQASIAILLITDNFLKSEFICEIELPIILGCQQSGQLFVFPVIAKDCDWQSIILLKQITVRPKKARAVWSDDGNHVDEDLDEIVRELKDIVHSLVINKISRYKNNLIVGRNPDASASALGDIAITYKDNKALSALWEAIYETEVLSIIINPCTYTIGKVIIANKNDKALYKLWEIIRKIKGQPAVIRPCAFAIGEVVEKAANDTLEKIGFEMFDKSTKTKCQSIIADFAWTVGKVALQAQINETKQRARRFVIKHDLSCF